MSEQPVRVPDDADEDWMPDDYEPPDYDDPGDFPEPDHKMTEEGDTDA
jgi:hypothetical protein